MNRPFRRGHSLRPARSGFTLIEILLATVIALIMLGAVVTVFASVMQSMTQTRAVLETADRLRSAAELLRSDLRGITVIPVPPRDPANNEGYLEYTEGRTGQAGTSPTAVNLDDLNPSGQPLPDSTVGDLDDVLMMTVRATDRPFVGRCRNNLPNAIPVITVESDVAEVAWFVRGNRLYRRQRLVAPKVAGVADSNGNGYLDPAEWGDSPQNFNRYFDIALHPQPLPNGGMAWTFSSLGDLTKPENRYAHQTGNPNSAAAFPFHPHRIGWQPLGLPTLAESASAGMATTWLASGILPPVTVTPRPAPYNAYDAWTNPFPFAGLDERTGLLNSVGQLFREAEDLVLTNVLAFDVKIWDPTAPFNVVNSNVVKPGDLGYPLPPPSPAATVPRGAYVDLNYADSPGISAFSGPGDSKFLTRWGWALGQSCVYDTWSNHYERDGLDQDGILGPDQGTDGFDNNGDGRVDDALETEAPPPYPEPCRGLQIVIRVFEPDSRQIRQITVVQDLLPK
ncbi:MAG: PulJ/GspJ family protein [Thermogutta sp.]